MVALNKRKIQMEYKKPAGMFGCDRMSQIEQGLKWIEHVIFVPLNTAL